MNSYTGYIKNKLSSPQHYAVKGIDAGGGSINKYYYDGKKHNKNFVIRDRNVYSDIFFQDDEKLYGFYLMVKVTKTLMGVPFSFEDHTLIGMFNSVYTAIGVFKRHDPNEVRQFIESHMPLNGEGIFSKLGELNKFLNQIYYKDNPWYNQINRERFFDEYPELVSRNEDFWYSMDKLTQEIACQSRMGSFNTYVQRLAVSELLSFYYYDKFTDDVEKLRALMENTFKDAWSGAYFTISSSLGTGSNYPSFNFATNTISNITP